MFAAIIAHFGLALLLPWLVRRFGRAAFASAAVLAASTNARWWSTSFASTGRRPGPPARVVS